MTTHPFTPKQARHACEQLLKADRADKTEKSILPSEVRVIDRLLERGLELEDAYAEIHGKLDQHPQALKVFFDLVQSTAAFWSPESNQEARRGRARLVEVNQEIERVAAHLAELLDERTELKNHSGFSCETLYHPVDAIHAAAARNYSYEQWVKARLEALTGQFDLKYWPLMALVAAVGSLIPIFGSILSAIPAVAIGLTQSPGTALAVLAWILGIHQLEANFLNPKIIGDAAKIHPVLVVFSLLVGEHFFQIKGALFAVPCMSIAQTIFLHFRESTMGLRDPTVTGHPELAAPRAPAVQDIPPGTNRS